MATKTSREQLPFPERGEFLYSGLPFPSYSGCNHWQRVVHLVTTATFSPFNRSSIM